MIVVVKERLENVRTLSDVSKLIREHYNYELADVMDELIKVQNCILDGDDDEEDDEDEFYCY